MATCDVCLMRGILRAVATDRLPNDYRGRAVTQFGILGPVEARRDGAEVRLGGRSQRAGLAVLLLEAGHVVSIERIPEQPYDGEAPAAPGAQGHPPGPQPRQAQGG